MTERVFQPFLLLTFLTISLEYVQAQTGCVGDDRYWDSAAQTCFLLAGTGCKINPSDVDDRCIPTAQCYNQNGSPVCVCHNKLQPNSNRTCHLVLGDWCNPQNDLCDPIPLLKCSLEHKCDCDKGAVYDDVRKTCVQIPGSPCAIDGDCIDGTSCAGSVCTCRAPSSVPNMDDPSQCVLSHGDPCDYGAYPFSLCYPKHLDCDVGGTCVCKGEGSSSSYNNETKSCLQWADKECDKEGMKCVPGAVCNDLNGSSQCRCKPPLSTSNNHCYLQVGQKCNQRNDLCDPEKYLSCDLEGKCTCGSEAVYIDMENTCQLLPGSNCTDTPARCIDGTQCGLNLNRTCDCDNPSALPSQDDPTKCYLHYGEDCVSDDDCDKYSHFVCVGDKCICNDEPRSIFNNRTKQCQLLTEETCSLEPGEMPCIPTAICKNSEFVASCQCRFPMSKGIDGFCYLQNEQNCTRQNDLCDPGKYLSCDLEGRCTCGNEAVYLETISMCQLLPGSNCTDTPGRCIDGTHCGSNSTCDCDNPFALPSNKDKTKCYLPYGTDCMSDEECDPYSHLRCPAGICICEDEPVTSIYNKDTAQCQRLADVICVPDEMRCIPTASCKRKDSQYSCQCKFPMSRGSYGFCYLQNEQNCTQTNDLCDPGKFLSCDYDGKCTCGKDAVYILTENVCRSLPGSNCTDSYGNPKCIEETHCRAQQSGIQTTCECINPSSLPSEEDRTKCFLPYGEICGPRTPDCDPYSHLSCSGGVCLCEAEPEKSIYDTKTRQCRRLADKTCLPEPGEMSCISTASCKKTEGKYSCQCKSPMSQGTNGFCYLQNGQNCTRLNDLCDPGKFLGCDYEGKCSCGSDAAYVPAEDICQLLPGSECLNSPRSPSCINGTECRGSQPGINMKCECNTPSSVPSKEDPTKCFQPYGEKCASHLAECDPYSHLTCKEEEDICICKGEPATSIYDKKTKQCQRLADQICVPEPKGMSCISTASCKMSEGNYTCQCRSPMSRGTGGFCYLQNGQNCTQQNDLCDPGKFLGCDYEGKCSCGSGAVYVTSENACQLLPGSECLNSPDSPSCINGTGCSLDQPGIKMKCKCNHPSSIPSKEDPTKCFLPYGEKCSPLTDCDPYAHLDCQGDLCLCSDEEPSRSRYDNKTRQCQRLADEECSPEPQGMSCIHTASCKMIDSKYSCQCRFPMSKGIDGLCHLQHKQNCTQTNDLCNPNKFLECDLEGVCSCGVGAIYDEEKQTCYLLPGADCTITPAGLVCIEGTKCTLDPMTRKRTCVCLAESSRPSADDPRKCVVSHGVKCIDPQVQCDSYSHLLCEGGECICQEEFATSTYDNRTESCLRLANMECLPEPGGMGCVPGAKCRLLENKFKCQCREPMSSDMDGFCVLQRHQNCTQLNDLCDHKKFLYCDQEGKCSCKRTAVYDNDAETCVLLPGTECPPPPDAKRQKCIDGTECRLNHATRKMTCSCSSTSSVPNKIDPTKCFVPYSGSCADAECDPYSHLECGEDLNVCRCQGEGETAVYDKETKKCLRLSEKECLPEPGGMGCIKTATCRKDDSRYKCECRFPMSRGSDGFCYLKHNQNCTRDNDLCDINQYLGCDFEGKCSCGVHATYDLNLETCLILPERECPVLQGNQMCVPSTKCELISSVTGKHSCKCPGVSRPGQGDPTRCILDHNQPCSNTAIDGNDICDPFQYLECSDTLQCRCSGGFSTWMDPETSTCYLKARQPCVPLDQNPFAQKCTPNSNCFHHDGTSRCVCKEGFVPNRNGQCFLPHLSKCSLKNDLCDPASFLECDLENDCTCGVDAIYNDLTSTCALLSNSTCSPIQTYPERQPCIPNAMCRSSSRKCECIQEFEENKDRQCFLPYSTPCDKSRDLCDPKSMLQCGSTTGNCLCQGEDDGYGWRSRSLKKCFRLAGSLCGRQDESECIPNAKCDPVDKKCTCNETLNLVPNVNGFCFVPHGLKCNTRNDLCDPAAFLECHQETPSSESICRCQREYEAFFEPKTSSCRLISDRPCNPGTDLIAYPEQGQLCDRNALCLANAPGNFTYRCRCNDKFFPNPEGICYLPYKFNCLSDPSECDPYGHLQCRRRKSDVRQCLCATDKMYYDEEIKQCLSFPGEICDISPTSQKCRKNAQCGKNFVCECKPGYEATPDGQCLLRYGEKCEGTSATECHHHANLECRSGYCLCSEGYIEHHFYDGGSNKTVCFPGYKMNCEEKSWPHFSKLKCSPDAFLTCNSTVVGGICQCQNPVQVFIGSERQCRSTRDMPCDNYQLLCVPGADCVQPQPDSSNSAVLKCQCAENYTANWMDPKFCISGSPAAGSSIGKLFILLSVLLSVA